jgi:hypothetical protein
MSGMPLRPSLMEQFTVITLNGNDSFILCLCVCVCVCLCSLASIIGTESGYVLKYVVHKAFIFLWL